MQPPASPDELTSDWLTSVLSAQGIGTSQVESCDVELLGGEQGMTGQLARLRIRYQHDRPELPTTLIAEVFGGRAGCASDDQGIGPL